MRKFLYCIFVIGLVCFSFYYTDLAASIIKKNDPIMKKIKKYQTIHKKNYINASINGLTLTPGVNGSIVNDDESYYAMKKYGKYNEDLMVFDEITPTISISNTYDKFISKGNSNKRMVSIIFQIRDYSYLTEIINILDSKSVKGTFFIEKYIVDDSIDLVKLINNSYHQIEVYSNDYSRLNFNYYNKKIKQITKEDLSFCISLEKETDILKACSESKLHTINPSIITNNFPYNDVKNKVEEGSIILLSNNNIVLRELPYIINYIKQRGYQIVTLSKLLEE